ncbi:MAG TPA: FixH family protein [Lacibacter sp.]|nr:FixH family protein [Lacibacter sp.]HMO88288.1 FixH family protein [Lacibacter sp.]HMP87104.1 FixH family protein [Lacibacter sp.]
MSWGYKILFAYLAFVAGIMFLVFKASNESFDLVEKNYYEEELKYQTRIDESNRTARLSEPVQVQVTGGQLQIRFPGDFNSQPVQGEVHLYYPANAKKDLRQPFTGQANELLSVALPPGNTGLHKLKLSWKVNDTTYYHEETVFL